MGKVLICADVPFASGADLDAYLMENKDARLDKVISGNVSTGPIVARVDILFGQNDLDAFFEAKGVKLFRARPYEYSDKTFRANKAGSSIKAVNTVTVVKN